MIIEITQKDLHAARSVNTDKQNATNCIVAQAVKRQLNCKQVWVGHGSIKTDKHTFGGTKKLAKIVDLFDDEQYSKLSKMLPTKVRLVK